MIKDLVVNLSTAGKGDPAADYAISIAETFGAHATGVAFAWEPVIPASDMGAVPADFVEMQRAASEQAARAATAAFDRAADKAGLSAQSRVFESGVADAAQLFGSLARRFDLSVVGQAERNQSSPEVLIAEAALFDSGRPAIVVPYIQKDPLKLDTVAVCWDGTRAAARAIGDASALLERAKSVHIVIVSGERGKSDEVPGADIAQHLARHGIKVEVDRVAASGIDVANAILSYAADLSADLLVMGGYGHSRLREFVLGGVTRSILASMTVPVLMSH
jgi:nucleotide-binding universal stress UspA family protein